MAKSKKKWPNASRLTEGCVALVSEREVFFFLVPDCADYIYQ